MSVRLVRKQIFSRRPAPVMSFVVEEAVLRRNVGGQAVVQEQLGQLLQIGRRRNVEIRVMPLDRDEHAGLAGPFTLAETFSQRHCVYVEVQNVNRLQQGRSMVRDLEVQ